MDRRAAAPLAVLAIATLACVAQAGTVTITYTGDQHDTGNGYGATLHILGLQYGNNDPSAKGDEHGAVVWDYGASADVLSGDTTNHSQTLTVAQVTTSDPQHDYTYYGPDCLGLILNLSQHGHDDAVGVTYFEFLMFDVSTQTTTVASWSGNLSLMPSGTGMGHSGYCFKVNGLADFIADDPNNRFGMRVLSASPFTGANDGPDVFFFGSFPNVVPLPPAAALGLGGLGTLLLLRQFRRRRNGL